VSPIECDSALVSSNFRQSLKDLWRSTWHREHSGDAAWCDAVI